MPPKTINEIEMMEPQNKNEKMWFSIIKTYAKETGFGKIELSLTVKNGVITNISETKCKKNINVIAN